MLQCFLCFFLSVKYAIMNLYVLFKKEGRACVKMDCRTAEGMVNAYINRTLTRKELEHFLDHIEHCSSCYEELETYFIVHEATKQLTLEEEFVNFDMKGLLTEDLKQTRNMTVRSKYANRLGYLLTGVAAISFVFYFIHVIIELI